MCNCWSLSSGLYSIYWNDIGGMSEFESDTLTHELSSYHYIIILVNPVIPASSFKKRKYKDEEPSFWTLGERLHPKKKNKRNKRTSLWKERSHRAIRSHHYSEVYLDGVFSLLCPQILPHGWGGCWTACRSWWKQIKTYMFKGQSLVHPAQLLLSSNSNGSLHINKDDVITLLQIDMTSGLIGCRLPAAEWRRPPVRGGGAGGALAVS